MAENRIRLIVGLGNPGAEYEATRHNAGFQFLDLVARRYGATFRFEAKFHGHLGSVFLAGLECRLLKPATFMNRSGRAAASICQYFKIPPEQLLVAHDELDLPCGSVRIKQGGGHAGHNGLRDIVSALGSRDFYRLRIGIDHPEDRSRMVDYVLSRASREDQAQIEKGLETAADALPEILSGEFQRAMNRLHAKAGL